MKTLFIPIENQKREFYGKCLLALAAANEGYQVIFGWDMRIFSMLTHAQRNNKKLYGILLFNGLADAEYEALYRYRQGGATILALPNEQLLPPFDPTDPDPYRALNWRVSERTLELAHSMLFWGEAIANRFIEYLPRLKSKYKVVGNLQFDILREPFLEQYIKLSVDIRQQHGPFILMLPQAAISFKEDEQTRTFHELQAQQYGFRVEDYYGTMTYCVEQKEAFVSLVKQIRRNYPDKKIVIRPHPVEDPIFWRSLCSDVGELIIDNSGNAVPWIIASDMLIHTGSSIGHQALFLQHPQIYFGATYEKDTTYAESVLFREFFCRNEEEVICIMEKYQQGSCEVNTNALINLKNIYENSLGNLAYRCILDAVGVVDWERNVVGGDIPERMTGGRSINLKFPPGRLAKKFQGITAELIKEQIKIIGQIIPGVKKLMIHELEKDVFILSAKKSGLDLRYTLV